MGDMVRIVLSLFFGFTWLYYYMGVSIVSGLLCMAVPSAFNFFLQPYFKKNDKNNKEL